MTPVRRRRTRGLAAAAVLVVAGLGAAAPSPAAAGNLYPYGASGWDVGGGASATVSPAGVFLVQAPALDPAHAGDLFGMTWACPMPGSEIAAVRFGGLRTRAPSSLAVRVTGSGRVLWAEGDVGMPQSPAGGRAYDVGLPGGHCDVRLALTQVETRPQHARGWFIDDPRILVRDVAAPSVTLNSHAGGWIRGASARVDWTAADNFGSAGMGTQRVRAGGRTVWSGAPGQGRHVVDVGVSSLGDGQHPLEVRVDGDGTPGASAGGARLNIDRTPPRPARLAASPSATPGRASFTWDAADALSGVAADRVQLNTATDGSTDGGWHTVATRSGGGRRSAAGVRVDGLADGVHAWRVRSADVAGNVSATRGPGHVVVDTRPPRLTVRSAPTGWRRAAALDVEASDNLQDALGLGAVEVDVNAARDGSASGEWIRAATSTAGPGRRTMPLDLARVPDGRHLVRVRARNGAPHSAALVAERRLTLHVDRTPPALDGPHLIAAGNVLTAAWSARDGHSGPAEARVDWHDGSAWRALGGAEAGAGRIVADLSAVPRGPRTVRLTVTDAAGNAARHVRTLTVADPPPAAAPAAVPPLAERLRTGRLTLTLPGSVVRRVSGYRMRVRTVPFGARIPLRGYLRDRHGAPIGRTLVEVRDRHGRRLARTRTRPNGRFAVRVRPLRGTLLRVGSPVGRRLLPARPSPLLQVRVRPRLRVRASARVIRQGQTVRFAGRLLPAPRALGLGKRKGVVLQWRDPLRGTWRPVVISRIAPSGRFAVRWRYGLRGIRIPMRVLVPAEVGWPLLPVRSRVIPVRIR